MEIIILSKEKVKPSTPTPPHLRNHKLCLIDQLAIDTCITPIFFYGKKLSENYLDHLKNTLSKTLTIFYPLAGELKKDSSFVDCNDNGVLFVEAHVKVRLDEFLQHPNLSQLINFLPQNASLSSMKNYVETLETLVSIQVTSFDCGGVAIGGVLPHKLLDGASMSVFFNTWAKIARGDNRVEHMSLDFTSSSLLFLAQNHFPEEMLAVEKILFFDKGDSIVRRFVFDAKAIESIKTKAASESVLRPSRVEALTAFIWKHIILAAREIRGNSRPCMVSHSVNLRPRLDTKLPNAFGNLVWLATSEFLEMSDQIIELPYLAGIVRELIENMNSENLKALEGDGALNVIATMAAEFGHFLTKVDIYRFSSWCRFGLYDIDFGWGKPIWVAPFIDVVGALLNKQQIILVENGSNDGVEVWILRNKEEMHELENDVDFLAYASPNPSVHIDYP